MMTKTFKPNSEPNSPSCTRTDVNVRLADLPLSCPQRGSEIWNAHPRVFLPIEEVGEIVCPYCGTTYRLADFQQPAATLKILPEKKISAKAITPEKDK